MRSMILGGCLATAAAGGVYFVAVGGGSPTHCGPCVSCPTPEPADAPESPPVVEVVDIAAELAKPAAPTEKRFVSFDEPPLAKQLSDRAKVPEVIQAAFEERDARGYWAIPWQAVEVAPMPRPVERPADPMPLAAPDNPY